MTTKDENTAARQKFEAWAKLQNLELRRSKKNNLRYSASVASKSWETWQAAEASVRVEYAPVIDALKHARALMPDNEIIETVLKGLCK